MLIVTGATGGLGHAVVEGLLARVPADQIAATTRDPDGAAALAARGVDVRRGDFADPGSLAGAFAGADQILIVSANKLGDEARQLHRTAIDAARDAGARRVLYTSHMGARTGSAFEPASNHAASEAMLAESGVPFTSLRHGFYAESALHMVGQGLRAGELRVPEDGPVSWTARADLAEADAAVLAGAGSFDGLSPALTASDAVTMAEMAAIASETTGREVRHATLTDEAWVAEQTARGVPEPVARLLLGAFLAARRGDFSAVDPALGALLGRRPQTMRDVLATFLAPAGA